MNQFLEPIDMLVDHDFPNTCPFDGARTELLELREGYTAEECRHCKRWFNFWEPENE